MKYQIHIENAANALFAVSIDILDDQDNIIMTPATSVSVPMRSVPEGKTQLGLVQEYVENVFLADLRNNIEELADLVLPIDSQG